jgi:hypothetical protein
VKKGEMNSFLLLPCAKPQQFEKQTLLSNGTVLCLGEGKIWRDGDGNAKRLVSIKNEQDVGNIKCVDYCESLDAFFFLIEGYSGVFACSSTSSLCMPLGFGRLTSGLRVAQPVRTTGPRTMCLGVFEDKACAGDAWGAVAIWKLDGNIADEPAWSFGAHDGPGCSSVTLSGEDLAITVGGVVDQIKVWRLLDESVVQLVASYTLNTGQRLSTDVVMMHLNESDKAIIMAGTESGDLLMWSISLNEELPTIETHSSFMNLSQRSRIRHVDVFENKLVLVSMDDGHLLLLDVRSLDDIHIVAKRKFTKPCLGLFEDMVVFDSFSTIPLGNMIDKRGNELLAMEADDEDDVNRVDVRKAIDFFMKSRATAKFATRRALNRPLHDESSFGKELIAIDPEVKNRRACCSGRDLPSNQPIWVKRRVKPPKVCASKRRPLYENPKIMSSSSPTGPAAVPVKLPPFCKTRTRPSWAQPEFYLKQVDGNIMTTTTVEK